MRAPNPLQSGPPAGPAPMPHMPPGHQRSHASQAGRPPDFHQVRWNLASPRQPPSREWSASAKAHPVCVGAMMRARQVLIHAVAGGAHLVACLRRAVCRAGHARYKKHDRHHPKALHGISSPSGADQSPEQARLAARSTTQQITCHWLCMCLSACSACRGSGHAALLVNRQLAHLQLGVVLILSDPVLSRSCNFYGQLRLDLGRHLLLCAHALIPAPNRGRVWHAHPQTASDVGTGSGPARQASNTCAIQSRSVWPDVHQRPRVPAKTRASQPRQARQA